MAKLGKQTCAIVVGINNVVEAVDVLEKNRSGNKITITTKTDVTRQIQFRAYMSKYDKILHDLEQANVKVHIRVMDSFDRIMWKEL